MRRGQDEGSPTDAQIIARSWEDPHAFARIFDRHHEAIYRFAWTRAGSDRADDLASEVFRIAFERRHDYDTDHASAKPWLFGIASNLAKQTHRETAKRSDAHGRVTERERQPREPDPAEHLDTEPGSSAAAAAVAELPERDREPLLLYAWGDLTYEEIADAIDVPVGTVRSRIHRARQEVRDRLEEAEPEMIAGRREDDDG